MQTREQLSPWWRQAVILILILGFSVLTWQAVMTYRDAPPIPDKVIGPTGETVFTGGDILAGQEVFLKYGLMENGSIWGHGAYLGPDFSAEYLHALALDAGEVLARERYGRAAETLGATERNALHAEREQLLKQNRYDPWTKTLTFTAAEVASYQAQMVNWTRYFGKPSASRGLPVRYVTDPRELQALTAFFAWTAWASTAQRPGRPYSSTNNFPYERLVGNQPTSDAVLWSALSLIGLGVVPAVAAAALTYYQSVRSHRFGIKSQAV